MKTRQGNSKISKRGYSWEWGMKNREKVKVKEYGMKNMSVMKGQKCEILKVEEENKSERFSINLKDQSQKVKFGNLQIFLF